MELQIEKERISSLGYNVHTKEFTMKGITMTHLAKYFKGVYSNVERFKARYIEPKFNPLFADDEIDALKDEKIYEGKKDIKEACREFINDLIAEFNRVEPYSYAEVFEVEDQAFQALLWTSVDIGQMVTNLGGERISTSGRPVKHKIFSKDGEFLGYEEYDCIYEVYRADAAKLSARARTTNEYIYAVKCWCTSTDKEHFIWIEDEYKDDPLLAIASTFRIHENLIPHIKELKRQGDILLVEMKDNNIEPEGDVRPLTVEEYFGLLTAQS